MSKIIFNSKVLEESELRFQDVKRLRYGDSIFESILFINGKMPLLSYHLERLEKSAYWLNYRFNKSAVKNNILNCIYANKLTEYTVRIRYTLIRKEGELYTPIGNQSSELIEVVKLKASPFKTIETAIFSHYHKEFSNFSHLKSGNSLLYVLAKQEAIEANTEDSILLDGEKQVVEAASSNIFWFKNDILYTTPLDNGCVAGVTRQYLIDNFEVTEKSILSEELLQVDEVFFTNGIQLVNPIQQIEEVKFSTYKTIKLISEVQEILKI